MYLLNSSYKKDPLGARLGGGSQETLQEMKRELRRAFYLSLRFDQIGGSVERQDGECKK